MPRFRTRRVVAPLVASLALLLVPALTAAVTATPSGGTTPPAPGSVITWGNNSYGYLGDGNATASVTAVQPTFPAGTVITSVATSHFATYAITSKGTVYSWGSNVDGQLGLGSSTGPDTCGAHPACSNVPALVDFPPGTVVTQVAAGHNFALAVTSAGKVYGWGYNSYGELGDGSKTTTPVPVAANVPAGTFVTAVAAGHDTGYALTSTGAVWAWGYNYDGELGNGDNSGPTTGCSGDEGAGPCSTNPVAAQLPPGVVVTGISAEAFDGLAVSSTGAVYAWGYNGDAELGNGTDTGTAGPCSSDPCVAAPALVPLPNGVVATSVVGGHFTAGVTTTSGQVYEWGSNDEGQLGNGNDTGPNSCGTNNPCAMSPVLANLPAGVKVTQLSSSTYQTFGLTSTGAVYAWGYNGDGELGLGSATGPDSCTGAPCSWTPVVATNVPSGASIISVQAGNFFTVLLTAPPQAYDLVGSDGGVFVLPTGSSGFFGSLPGLHVKVNNVVGIVPTNNDTGYDLVGSDGGVFVFPTGQATGFFGSLPGLHVKVSNVVGIVPTNHGTGYDLVGSDGGVFVFPTGQTTGFFGSLPGLHVTVNNIVGIVSAPGGTGYFLVGRDGGVFTFGRAPFLGSLPGEHISVNDITGIATTADGRGYYVVGANGAVYPFGDATSYGSVTTKVSDIKSIVPTATGRGYWLIGADGNVYPFGDATAQGNLPGLGVKVSNIVGAVPVI